VKIVAFREMCHVVRYKLSNFSEEPSASIFGSKSNPRREGTLQIRERRGQEMRVQDVAGAKLVIYASGKRATKRRHIMLLCVIT
jgi:hypothetical protein